MALSCELGQIRHLNKKGSWPDGEVPEWARSIMDEYGCHVGHSMLLEHAYKAEIAVYQKLIRDLVEMVCSVVPYVVATLPKPCDGHDLIWRDATGADPDGWSACHKGRAFSSVAQLEWLEKTARNAIETVEGQE